MQVANRDFVAAVLAKEIGEALPLFANRKP